MNIQRIKISIRHCYEGIISQDLCLKVILDECASLERVVSAPQARNHESQSKADLGPVRAPCACIEEVVPMVEAACHASGHALIDQYWPSPESRAKLQASAAALKEAVFKFAHAACKQAEAARAAGAAQGAAEAAR